MGKFVYAVIMVFVIELALYLFGGTSYSTTSLFNLLFNPSILISSPFYILITVALAAFAASAIIPGNLYQINIYALYAGMAAIFITFTLSIIHLWQFTYGELSGILTMNFAQIITTLIIAPFLIYYLLASAEWVRSNT